MSMKAGIFGFSTAVISAIIAKNISERYFYDEVFNQVYTGMHINPIPVLGLMLVFIILFSLVFKSALLQQFVGAIIGCIVSLLFLLGV